MLAFMVKLFFIVFLIALFVVARTYLRLKKEKKLRENYPKKKVIEIRLPGGTDDARFTSASFWAKVARTTTADPKARAEGTGQIDFKFLAEVHRPRAMPSIRCIISADEERMDSIKKSLKTVYEDIAVIELDEDPLLGFLEEIKEPEETEPEHRNVA